MEKNIEEAKKWLRKAIEAGSQEAIEKLKLIEAQEGYKSERFGLVKVGSIIKFGNYPQNTKDKKVDVHNPDYLLKIEIRSDYTYIYTKEIKALGGYPVGVAGKGLLMLSGGIDSPVAGYMAMKRGIKLECIYFESPPHTSPQALNKVKKLVSILNKFCFNIFKLF